MKNQKLTLLLVFLVVFFEACSDNTDSKKTAENINADKVDSMRSDKVDSTKTNLTPIAVNKDDAKFAVDAANGGMAEVALGKIAEQKSTTKNVKDFATRMIADHSKVNNELTAIAKSKGITLPENISNDEQKIVDDLSKKTGKEFERAYVKEMLDDHEKDVKAFEGASKTCNDAGLQEFATKTLPILKMHLGSIKQIHDGIK